jgi:SNF2 family DNA or RNA helicase
MNIQLNYLRKPPKNDRFIGTKTYLSIFLRTRLKRILKESGFQRELTEFQARDVARLLALRHGANFSVPGAGKTTTLLTIFVILRSERLVERLVVVAPINAFISWEEEVSEIFPDRPLSVERLRMSDLRNASTLLNSKADVLLVNYEKLRRDVSQLIPYFLTFKIHFVLDESHRIKGGENNLSFLNIVRLSDLAVRRDILSGTPMPQSAFDLNPQFEFLWNEQAVVPRPVDDSLLLQNANRAIEGKFTRTTKSELQLDDPVIHVHHVKMGPIQSELYDLIRSELNRKASGLDFQIKQVLRSFQRSVMRLMQVATNPMLLGAENEFDEDLLELPAENRIWEVIREFAKYEKPAKVQALRDLALQVLAQSSDTKIVVWTYFVRNIGIIQHLLKEFNPVAIYGAIPSGSDEDETKREGVLRKFKTDPATRVLVANPQACGEGISLHKVCHTAIYLDRTFNAAHYLQSVDRIHRVGLPENTETRIEILQSVNTIDVVINERLEQKAAAMRTVLNDDNILELAYDPADIEPADESGLDLADIEAISAHLRQK